ncbi:unnamed protein product [Owenia fusiformis]|uniref:Uncharacterized protein n=1 Tax=Owenia fusiformis TaxID=6347 RepID=A0A8J1TML5_OWEFU|nr:unnamed protein product [Owenia fusiformis]
MNIGAKILFIAYFAVHLTDVALSGKYQTIILDGPKALSDDIKDTKIVLRIEGKGALDLLPPSDTGGIVCADVLMLIDISCSISNKDKQRVRNISALVAHSLLTSVYPEDPTSFNLARIGVLTYSEKTRHVLYLNNSKSSEEIDKIIRNVEIRKSKQSLCRTSTHRALSDARTFFFKSKQNNKQIINLFTDGLTFLRRNRKALYREQRKLREMGVIINVIQVRHRKGKYEENEYINLPHTQNHLFESKDKNITSQLIDRLIEDASCANLKA